MWKLQGHDALLRRVEQSIRDGRYAHAYLIVGPPQVGKRTLALDMARALNCLSTEDIPCGTCIQCARVAAGQHADVRVISIQSGAESTSRTEIGIDEVRDLQRQASLKPYEGSHRVFVVDGAQQMSEEAANALLKTLEEPPPQVVIILLSPQEDALLPTVRSRCRRLELRPLAVSEVASVLAGTHSVEAPEAERLARLSMGRLGWALSALEDASMVEEHTEEVAGIAELSAGDLEARFAYASELASLHFSNRSTVREALHGWLRWWRDLLLINEGAGEFVYNVDWRESLDRQASQLSTRQAVEVIRSLLRTLDALEDNANARLALEVLMLNIPEQRTSP